MIIDLGCGDGKALQDLSKLTKGKAKLIGIAAAYPKNWKKHPEIEYRVVPYHKLKEKLPHKYADLVYSYYGIWPGEMRETLYNVHAILKPGGMFVFNLHFQRFQQHEREIKELFNIKYFSRDEADIVTVHLQKPKRERFKNTLKGFY